MAPSRAGSKGADSAYKPSFAPAVGPSKYSAAMDLLKLGLSFLVKFTDGGFRLVVGRLQCLRACDAGFGPRRFSPNGAYRKCEGSCRMERSVGGAGVNLQRRRLSLFRPGSEPGIPYRLSDRKS